MKKKRKPEQFIKTPAYPGGTEAMSKFIRENLRYPKAAIDNNIEGTVQVAFSFNESGRVIKTRIEHGIGYGCDEEAERIVRLFRYPRMKNKGMRVTYHSKVNIHFRLKDLIARQGVRYQYRISSAKEGGKEEKTTVVYHYRIPSGK
jgi:TonB family protein